MDPFIVNCPLFHTDLLENLANLIELDGYHDVILQAGNIQIKAVKVLLASSSSYFRSMFTRKGFKEYNESIVVINDIEPDALSCIIKFISSSKMEIDQNNIYSLVSAADFLSISHLKIYFSSYMRSSLKLSNCLQTLIVADTYSYTEVRDKALHFCTSNFQEVTKLPDFTNLPFHIFLQFISSSLLNVRHEGVVLKAVVKWVADDIELRRYHLDCLLSHIRLQHIPLSTLKLLQDHELLKINSEFYKKFEDVLNDPQTSETVIVSSTDKTRRYSSEQEVIMAIGGRNEYGVCSTVECFTTGYLQWRNSIPEYVVLGSQLYPLRVIPTMSQKRSFAASCYDRHNIYIVGGMNNMDDVLCSCEMYNVHTNLWTQLPSLPQGIYSSAAVICKDALIVIGGATDDKPISSVWALDLRPGKCWKEMPPLPTSRFGHCAVSIHGFIYVLGGVCGEHGEETSSTMRYDPILKSWRKMKCMINSRLEFGAAVINDSIYVLGGCMTPNADGLSTERYDVLSDTWTEERDIKLGSHSFGMCVSEDKHIYCLGGRHYNDNLDSVTKYNPINFISSSHVGLKFARIGLSGAMVCVPVRDEAI